MQVTTGGAAASCTGVCALVSFCAQSLPVVQFLAALIAVIVGAPHAVRITRGWIAQLRTRFKK